MGGLSNPSDSEYAFSAWKDLIHPQLAIAVGAAAAGGTYVYLGAGVGYVLVNTANSGAGALWLDRADYAAGSRTIQVRVRGELQTNAVAPAADFTYGLYPVTGHGGGSGLNPTVTSVGAATVSVTRSAPAASSQFHDETSAVSAPTAGWFALCLVLSTTTAALSAEYLRIGLQYRQV